MFRMLLQEGIVLVAFASVVTPSHAQPLLPPPTPSPAENAAVDRAAPRQPGYLGLVVEEGTVRGQGVLVRNVDIHGPAHTSGLRSGDLLNRIGGREIHDVADFGLAVVDVREGEELEIDFERQGIPRHVSVTLTERPAPEDRLLPEFGRVPAHDDPAIQSPAQPSPETEPVLLGIVTATVSEGARRRLKLPHRRGALVVAVEPDSPAALAEIPTGAVIWAMDGRDVNTPEGLENRIRAAGAGTRILLTFQYAGEVQRRYVDLGGFHAAGPDNAHPMPQTVPGPMPPSIGQPISPGREFDMSVDALKSRLDEIEARVSRLETMLEAILHQQGRPNRATDSP